MDDGIWMSGGVVEKLGGRFHCFFVSLCLFGCDYAELCNHSAVNGAGVIKSSAEDALGFVDTCFFERGYCCRCICEL